MLDMAHYSLAMLAHAFDVNHNEKKVERFLAWLTIELAATICGSKPSTILTLIDTKQQALLTMWKEHGCKVLDSTLVEFISLRSAENKETILFYRSDVLEKCITNTHHKNFLQSLGYRVNEGVDACLALLKKRFQCCCPHEMGVLLGIPLKDVLGFMAMTNLPQTCRKEWCIYGNQQVSLAVMQKFAEDRSFVTCMLTEGIKPYEIMCGNFQASHIA